MNILFILLILGFLGITYWYIHKIFKGQPMKHIQIGQKAPSFALPDETNTIRTLEEFKGKKIVLYFYPKDATPGCTTQACGLRDSYEDFQKHDIVVIGISYDSPESHKAFKQKEHLPFILLSDSKREVAHAYGTDQHLMGSMYPQRTTFLIDQNGIITHIFEKVTPKTHAKETLKALGF